MSVHSTQTATHDKNSFLTVYSHEKLITKDFTRLQYRLCSKRKPTTNLRSTTGTRNRPLVKRQTFLEASQQHTSIQRTMEQKCHTATSSPSSVEKADPVVMCEAEVALTIVQCLAHYTTKGERWCSADGKEILCAPKNTFFAHEVSARLEEEKSRITKAFVDTVQAGTGITVSPYNLKLPNTVQLL